MQRKALKHAPLVPTCRVFFDEFLKSDFFLEEDGVSILVTPTCARCKSLFGVGEVEEVETRGNVSRITLNDLTASLSIYTTKNKPLHVERSVEASAGGKKTFFAFLGDVHVREGAGRSKRAIILAEEVGTVEERVRNGWILNTAWRTMERANALRSTLSLPKEEEPVFLDQDSLKQAREHYALDSDKLDLFAGTAINAVKRMWQHYHTTTSEIIVEMVKNAGTSGMEREKLVSALKNKGLHTKWIEEVIDELIMDEHCYEQDTGVLRC